MTKCNVEMPKGAVTSQFYRAQHDDDCVEDIEIVHHNGKKIIKIFYSRSLGTINSTFFGRPIEVEILSNFNEKTDLKKTVEHIQNKIIDRGYIFHIDNIRKKSLIIECINKSGRKVMIGAIDLTKYMLSNYGKKRRYYIKKALENIPYIVLDKDNIRFEHILRLKNIHQIAANRQTRSDLTWELQYERIIANEAILVLSEHDEYSGGAYFPIYQDKAWYGVSASLNKTSKYNISDGLVHTAAQYLKKIDIKLLELGEIYNEYSTDPKYNNIMKYKQTNSNLSYERFIYNF